jgi:hypothetical protein
VRRASTVLASLAFFAALLSLAVPALAAEESCELEPKAKCFGVESLDASLSTTQAGAHPDLTFTFDIKQDPESKPNVFGLRDAYALTRSVRTELPPGLIGDPNVLGVPQQCTVNELITTIEDPDGGCPNGSQVGRTHIFLYDEVFKRTFLEPIYMMQPPGGDVVARLGFIAGLFPTFVDLRVRSEGDYGLVAEITDASTEATLVKAETTIWGVPADPSHDTERCTAAEVLSSDCMVSPPRPPGSRPLPFLTNPTRCGVPLETRVAAASWAEPQRFDTKSDAFPQIGECNRLPFGPSLVIEPTNHRAGAPTGLDITVRAPASDGVDVLEPSQTRDIRVTLPAGLTVNAGSADGLGVCNEDQVHFGERIAAECPDAAKLADFEADIAALPRRMKGAIYLRDPEPGNLFRVWLVADDLGAHVKLRGQLNVNKQTGQIESVLLDLPQAPLREVKLVFKSGLRAPLVNPSACGGYASEYEFAPWAGGPSVKGFSPITIDEWKEPGDECKGIGGFSPKLSAGTANPVAGKHSPFLFTLIREDGEQNPAAIDIILPQGLAATFAGVPRCEGGGAETGACPAASRIGKVIVAVGAGPVPLWVPQPGKRPTAVYLSGPYKGAPFSVVAVVPAQAGPFDLGDEVVRSAIYVDSETAQGTVKSDPLPQIIEGVPIHYRTIYVELDRPNFTLNPTGCKPRQIEGAITSKEGTRATLFSPFQAVNCASLGFKPKFFFRLFGRTSRGGHPKLRVVVKPRPGDANIGKTVVALPRSEFLDQSHIKTVCTRVQFVADQCPPGSIYGHARALSPLLDQPLEGPVYLRSSNNLLPDLVVALDGEVDFDLVGKIDSIHGGIRTTFGMVPDAAVTKFVLTMQGGKKGLLINSRNLCKAPTFVDLDLDGHNGKRVDRRVRLSHSCGKAKAKSRGNR